jgi:hypothetical protein
MLMVLIVEVTLSCPSCAHPSRSKKKPVALIPKLSWTSLVIEVVINCGVVLTAANTHVFDLHLPIVKAGL